MCKEHNSDFFIHNKMAINKASKASILYLEKYVSPMN